MDVVPALLRRHSDTVFAGFDAEGTLSRPEIGWTKRDLLWKVSILTFIPHTYAIDRNKRNPDVL